jgi:hypothetical protein
VRDTVSTLGGAGVRVFFSTLGDSGLVSVLSPLFGGVGESVALGGAGLSVGAPFATPSYRLSLLVGSFDNQ